jgi:para-nitrobenzyl esterase
MAVLSHDDPDQRASHLGAISRRGFIGLVAAAGTAVLLGDLAVASSRPARAMGLAHATGNSGAASADLVIRTQQGDLEGTAENGVRIWRGIPFAQPPADDLRGRSPRPPQTWTGVRSASQFGPQAVQLGNPDSSGGSSVNQSENCLHLHVWAPGEDGDRLRPVIVWIHGGGFIAGTGSDPGFDGTLFAGGDDLLYVTINYRLGVFGYLLNDRDLASQNLGLLDQIAALQWARDNIASFGGDPQLVI